MAGPRLRAFRSRAIFRALQVVAAIGRRIPLPIGRALGRMVGSLAWHVARRERRKALQNIAVAFPDWSDAQRRDTVRAMFRHHGMSLFEIGWLPNLTLATLDRTTSAEGLDRVMARIDEGRGVVAFTGHCGNWEWVAYVAGLQGRPMTVLQRERNEADLSDFITNLRAGAGIRTIDRGSASSGREMIQVLRKGGMMCFLIDQNIRAESAKVPFFGRPALTPIGPAKLAIRTGALVTCAFIQRTADGRQSIRWTEPFETTRDDDPIELTARLTREIEEQIRRAPEQWVWMHDRWRERPKWDVAGEMGE